MSPRPKNIRKVNNMPPVAGFKPIASNICRKDAIFLHFEEYEAIRLCDYEMKTQHGKEPTTLKELAAVLGKETIDTYNTGEGPGINPVPPSTIGFSVSITRTPVSNNLKGRGFSL